MDNEDNIIEGEIVDNLPAVIERSHESTTWFKAERVETEEEREVRRASLDGRDWVQGPRPERRCTAHSSRTGMPCKNAAIKGHNVCRFHGGATKQIKQAARNRLDNAADRMARELLGIALTSDSESMRLTAIRDALDRIGISKPTEIVVGLGESKPWEQVYDDISAGGLTREQSRAARGYVEPAEPERETASYDAGSERAEASSPSAPAFTAEPSAPDVPPREAARSETARERHAQRPVRHIQGEDALRVAAQLLREQRAIER